MVVLFPLIIENYIYFVSKEEISLFVTRESHTSQSKSHDEILNSITEGVIIIGEDKKVKYHNKAFLDLFKKDCPTTELQ